MANLIYFINNTSDTAVAYDFDGNRQSDDDISLGTGDWQGGVASDDRLYFINNTNDMAVAWDFDGNRQSGDDISLGTGSWQGGVASDDRIYFINESDNEGVAYDFDGNRQSTDDIALGNGFWAGSAASDDRLYFINISNAQGIAYDFDGNRQSADDISLGSGLLWGGSGTDDRLFFIRSGAAEAYDFDGNRQSADDISLGSGTWQGGATSFEQTTPPTNNAPSFANTSYAFSDVAIAVNTVVGTVAATDADDDTLSYSLTGADASNFSIDSDGEITVTTALTNGQVYNINVVADDGTDTTSVAVTITAVAAAVTPTLGWEVPSEAVGNTFSATLTSNVALDDVPSVSFFRLRDDDNTNPIIPLNTSNTTITLIAGTNNYLIELELTGTYDDDYTIRLNGGNVQHNGQNVISGQLISAVFSIDSSVGTTPTPPTFTAPSDYEVNERADDTIDSTDFFSGHTSLAFKSGTTPPSWATISGLDIVITDAPDVTDDTDYDIELTATNADGDVDGTITIAVQQIDPAPVIGTISRIDVNEGASKTVDLSGSLQNTDTLVMTSSQSWVSISGSSLVITTAPSVAADTDYTVNLRAESDSTDETDTGSVVIRVADVPTPVVNNPPSFSESSYSFLDVAIAVNTVVGTVAATDADNDTLSYSLTGTDASNFAIDSDGEITVATALTYLDTYTFNVVADDGTDTTNVVVTVTAEADPAEIVVLKSPDALTLYKQALNKETTPSEAGDNDYSTWTTQTTITCDIRDDASNAQAFETIFVKGSGIDSYAVAVDGSNLGTRTVPDAIQVEDAYPEIDDISITRDGWQHDMIEISEQTGSSVVLTFSGTNIRINEVLILRKSVILNSNYAKLSHAKVDISSNIEESETGDETREIIVGRDRLRWMSSCALEFTFEDDNYEVFLDWIEDNPNPVVAQNPELYPWRVYKAVFPDMQHNAPYISSVIEVGNLVEFRLLENRRIGESDLILKRTFNSEDSPGKYLFFNDCVHLDNDRVTKIDGSIDYNASDNDLQTYSSETPLEFDISEGSDATKVTHIWMKSTGVTAYEIQTLVGNTWTTQETLTPTRSAYRGYDNSLEKLTTAITATSMRLAFTGSSVKIFEVMLLEHAGGLVTLSNVLPKKSDRTSVVQQTQDGEIERVETELSSRFKWQLDFSAAFGHNNTHKLEDFLDWINSNPNFTFAERPEVNPWRVYPAGFLNSGFNASFITQTVQIGELVQCQLSER